MISIDLHRGFVRAYKKRIAHDQNLVQKVSERSKLFQENQNHPLLRVHLLKGQKDRYFAFSVTGDIRVVFEYLDQSHVLFIDIGTHNQVY